mgnify:CR=1 FL=1
MATTKREPLLDIMFESAYLGRLEYIKKFVTDGKMDRYAMSICYGIAGNAMIMLQDDPTVFDRDPRVDHKKHQAIFDYLHDIKLKEAQLRAGAEIKMDKESYMRNLEALRVLFDDGQKECPEADDLRHEMDIQWYALTDAEREEIAGGRDDE